MARHEFRGSTVVTAIVAAALGAGASHVGDARRRTGRRVRRDRALRTGKPNFGGVWQALNEAHWDLQAHEARPAW